MSKDVVLLFFPKVNADNTRFMPYSVLHLERMIREYGLNVFIIDEQIENDYEQIIANHVDNLFLAVTTAATGYQINGAVAFSKTVKKLNAHSKVLWAGWHCSLLPELTLKEKHIDFVIKGQSETAFRELVEALIENKPYDHIKGLGYKEGTQLLINPQRVFEDINNFPDIDFSLINPEHYVFENTFAKRNITYFASHGCPFRCEFCSLATVFKGKWYAKKIKTIISDIKHLKKSAQIDAISFWDDNFFTEKDFSLSLAKSIIDNNLNIKWECCTHAGLFNKLFTDDDIALFRKSGLRQIFIGAESGDEDILKLVSKHIRVEDNYTFVSKLKKHNIVPVFLLIVCFPSAPDKDLKATLNMVRRAKLLNNKLKIRLHLFVPVPHTKMFDVALSNGLVMPDKLEDYADFLYKFKAPWITQDYRWILETFVNFYVPLADADYYKNVNPLSLRVIAFFVNMLFYPIVFLRFKFNYFKYPYEAVAFLKVLRLFNKLFKKNFSLGSESYLKKNQLGFYNSYCG